MNESVAETAHAGRTLAEHPPSVDIRGAGLQLVARGLRRTAGTAELVASECTRCGARAWPPLPRCAVCWSDVGDIALRPVGTLYSFSVIHVAPAPWAPPYAVGYIDLPDGVRVFAHLRGAVESLRIDGPVQACFGAAEEMPPFWFEPVDEDPA